MLIISSMSFVNKVKMLTMKFTCIVQSAEVMHDDVSFVVYRSVCLVGDCLVLLDE